MVAQLKYRVTATLVTDTQHGDLTEYVTFDLMGTAAQAWDELMVRARAKNARIRTNNIKLLPKGTDDGTPVTYVTPRPPVIAHAYPAVVYTPPPMRTYVLNSNDWDALASIPMPVCKEL